MLKSLLRDSALYTASTVLTRGISFLLLPVYTRVLTPEEFGILDYFVVLGAIASIVVTLEILQGFSRNISDFVEDKKRKSELVSTCIWFVVGTNSLMLVAVTIFSVPLATVLLDSPSKASLIELAGWSYWVGGIFNVILNQLRWEIRAIASAILSLLSAVITFVFTLFLVVLLELGIQGALLAQIIGGFLSLLPGFYLVRSSIKFKFDEQSLKNMLAFSIPLVPSSLGVIVATYFDRIAIKELLSFSDLGIYAIALKISMIISLVFIGFRGALTPLIYANHKIESTPRELAKIFMMFCYLTLLMSMFISIFSKEIVFYLLDESFKESYKLIPYLVLSAVLSNMYIFAPGLDIHRKTLSISAINILIAIISIPLNYIFIINFGIMGAALAGVVSFGIGFIIYMYMSQIYYPVPHDWKKILKIIFFTLSLITFSLAMDSFEKNNIYLKIIIAISISIYLYKNYTKKNENNIFSAR